MGAVSRRGACGFIDDFPLFHGEREDRTDAKSVVGRAKAAPQQVLPAAKRGFGRG